MSAGATAPPAARPLVSFCIPTYGRARFIGRTLESALAQTVTDLEIVVVDDCSPDDTRDVVTAFADPRVRYSRNAVNQGVPQNLNVAMAQGRGEFLVLLEDHDLLEPTFLEEALAVFRRHPSVGLVATGLITIDEDDRPLERYVEDFEEFVPGRRLLRRLLVKTACPFPVTTVIRRSAAEGIEPLFDPRYWWYADQYLWIRLSARADFGYVARPLMRFRMREAGHYLTGREWESVLCLSRIHADNWTLLHPRPGPRGWLDRCLYEADKLRDLSMLRAARRWHGDPWAARDDEHARRYLSAVGNVVFQALDLTPRLLIQAIRRIRRSRHARRRALRA